MNLAYFAMLVCKICHFFRSVSDHDKYGMKLKFSTLGVHSCTILMVLVVAVAKNQPKTGEIVIFVICVILN